MSNVFNKAFGETDTSKQTPIEIVLGVDSQGMTTATKLYEFLELNPSNYSKWFKKNITENEFAEENTDYFPFVLQYESLTGKKERQDAKLTAGFAKKLSMMQKNEKGEEARKYFIQVEDGAKKMVDMLKVKQIPLTDRPDRVAQLINTLSPLMKKNDSSPYDIVRNAQLICEQYGIKLIDNFAKAPEYEQIELQL